MILFVRPSNASTSLKYFKVLSEDFPQVTYSANQTVMKLERPE
jgi:hypothetical protein